MFWSIAFFVASMVLSYVVASSVSQPSTNSTPGTIEPPTIEEGIPVAVLFGSCNVTPQMVWIGDIGTEAIKSKGGKK